MTCRFDHELVSLYADGELPLDRLFFVEVHISSCGECSMLLQDMRQIGIALGSLPRGGVPHGLVERIVLSAGLNLERSAWDALKWTVGTVMRVAMRGFVVDNELEERLRRESPPWVARWVLYV